jgi:hypothetical protein
VSDRFVRVQLRRRTPMPRPVRACERCVRRLNYIQAHTCRVADSAVYDQRFYSRRLILYYPGIAVRVPAGRAEMKHTCRRAQMRPWGIWGRSCSASAAGGRPSH